MGPKKHDAVADLPYLLGVARDGWDTQAISKPYSGFLPVPVRFV
jgi:hypothetical protein